MVKENILVVDDDKEIVRLVRGYLRQAGYDVLVAYDGETAVHTLRRENVDLLVLDLMLPDRDGWDITRLIRSDPSLAHTPIIMLTARVDDVDKILGLELGADDYVTKPFNPRELVARVRALLRRSQADHHPATQVLQVADLHLDAGRREVTVAGRSVDLTPTEFDLLRALMKSPGYAFTRDELMEKGLGYAYTGMGRTLDSHVKNLRQKIEPDPKNPIYIETVYGVGYRLSDSPERDHG
ncbi:MAG: response regulator transcription factor [Candidatus Promineifilaceae bacterium]|nr:response regulator transcription factor [Candidatus Promineifilaceae bacterium]